MNCHTVQQTINDTLTGDGSDAEHQQMIQHLNQCSRCRMHQENQRQLWALMEQYPEPPAVHSNFTDSVMKQARLLEQESTVIAFPKRLFWHKAAAACVLISLLAAGTLFTLQSNREVVASAQSDDMMVSNQELLENLELLQNLEFYADLDLLEAMGDSI